MGIVGCMECGSVHRNVKQYALHIQATQHRKIEDNLWYVCRIGRNEGLFVQIIIQELGWTPFYTVEESETESILHIWIAEKENISLLVDRREICPTRTFDYFDIELSIYTVHLVFQIYRKRDRSFK